MSQTSKLSRKGLAESALRIAIAAAQVLGAVGGSAIGLIRPPATEALIGVPAAAAASTAADAASAPLASDVAAPSAVLLMTSAINGTTQNACAYTNLYDSGGSGASYSVSEDVTVVLDAGAGLSVKLAFTEFKTETNFDFLHFYDGNSTSATKLGRYHGTTDLPPVIRSSGRYLTIQWVSDYSVTNVGFAAAMSCVATAMVGNRVFYDVNGDGLSDDFSPLDSVSIDLLRETTPGSGVYSEVDSTMSKIDGSGARSTYQFVVDQAANYRVRFAAPSRGEMSGAFTSQTATAGVDNNSDADTTTGLSPVFALDPNGTGLAKANLTIDAGYIKTCSVDPAAETLVLNASLNGTTQVVNGGKLDGSQSNAYLANESYVVTLRSAMTGGRVNVHPQAELTTLGTGDTLYFYDGTSTAAPLLGSLNSTSNLFVNFVSSGENLTVRFVSDSTSQGNYTLEYSVGDLLANNTWGWSTLLRSDQTAANLTYVIADNNYWSGNVPLEAASFNALDQLITPPNVMFCLNPSLNAPVIVSGMRYGGASFTGYNATGADLTPLQSARVAWMLRNAAAQGVPYNTDLNSAASVQDAIKAILYPGSDYWLPPLGEAALAAVPTVPAQPVLTVTAGTTTTVNTGVIFTITTNASTLQLAVSDGGALPTLTGSNPVGTSLSGITLTVGGSGIWYVPPKRCQFL